MTGRVDFPARDTYSQFMRSAPGSSWHKASAVLALLAVISMLTLPLLHDVGDDDACTPGAAAHNAAHHGVRAAPAADDPHCAICHLWQAVSRFGRPAVPAMAVPGVDFGFVAKASIPTPEAAVTASRPARAPPSA